MLAARAGQRKARRDPRTLRRVPATGPGDKAHVKITADQTGGIGQILNDHPPKATTEKKRDRRRKAAGRQPNRAKRAAYRPARWLDLRSDVEEATSLETRRRLRSRADQAPVETGPRRSRYEGQSMFSMTCTSKPMQGMLWMSFLLQIWHFYSASARGGGKISPSFSPRSSRRLSSRGGSKDLPNH